MTSIEFILQFRPQIDSIHKELQLLHIILHINSVHKLSILRWGGGGGEKREREIPQATHEKRT